MLTNKIDNIIDKMTSDINKNIRIINEEFTDLNVVYNNKETLLHLLLNNKNNEEKTMNAIKTILSTKRASVNLKNNSGDTFIQTALWTGYSERFILELINTTLKYYSSKFNINSVDNDGNTIMHTAIISENYTEGINTIYKLLLQNGFNSTIKNKRNEDILKTLNIVYEEKSKYSFEQVKQFKKIYNSKEYINNIIIDQEKISKYGKILNNKEFHTNPTVGREEQIENLIIGLASDKVSPLVVGERGIGKTILIDELVYRIKNNQVPEFLKNKIIIEVNPSELVAGTKYAGTFEEKIKELMEICKKNDAILFIDNIDRVCGTGTHDKSSVDMASMLSSYIERDKIKIIGTISKEAYNTHFSNNSFKENFYVINAIEPDYNTLYKIIEKTIIDYGIKMNINTSNLLYESNIIDLLIELTSKKHRIYNDNINNPKLVISIIDLSFAYAKSKDSNILNKEHITKGIDMCNRIYPTAKENIIKKINNEQNVETKNTSKVLKIDFSKR